MGRPVPLLRLALVFLLSSPVLLAASSPSDGVPEPSTLLLVGTGLVGVAMTTRLRRRRAR